MPLSFTNLLFKPEAVATKRRVLATGAAGNIGAYFAEHSSGRYDLRLLVHKAEDVAKLSPFGEVIVADLSDLEGLKAACEGIDTVLHMAGDPSPDATWHELLNANIIGSYNMLVAAKAAGCRRLIYASSIHAVSGYPADVQVKTSEPVNPGDLYGVSKCCVEALGRYMAEQEGLSFIALRIGAFQPKEKVEGPEAIKWLDAWVSERDLNQLIERCVDDTRLNFAIFNGLSNNRFKRLDISDARELVGYAPEDDFTEINAEVEPLHLDSKVGTHSQRDGYRPGIREELAELA